MGDLYLSEDIKDIRPEDVDEAIRKAALSQKAVPLMCGSALKNKGVQPLLDGVLRYLPSPATVQAKGVEMVSNKKVSIRPDKKGNLCALAFKVVNDKEKGPITFFRVYQGVLKNRAKLKNATLNQSERVQALLRVRADETQLLNEIGSGDIGAVMGLKNVRSGDTLIDETDA